MKAIIAALTLFLSGAVWSEPFTSKEQKFRADFGGKVASSFEKNPPGWLFAHEGAEGSNLVAVVKTPKPMTRYQALQWLYSGQFDLPKSARVSETSVGGRPGLHVEGLNGEGIPFSVNFATRNDKLYLVGSKGMNLAAQRKFLNSFRLLP